MDIKNTVTGLCRSDRDKRHLFIEDYLNGISVKYLLHKYHYGVNIEVIFEGKDKNHEFLIMSHYDIFSNSTDGANDNSSSVSVLLHLVKYLKKNKPYYTIRIVFNDKEELVGGVYTLKKSKNNIAGLLEKCGSFQYLKKTDKSRIRATLILELSGIGDCIFIASNSGNIKCSEKINAVLKNTALNNSIKYIEIPVLPCDYLSVHANNMEGSVIGMIQYEDAKKYLDDYNKNGINKNNYPYVWKKIHTSLDNVFSIQEKALEMIYNFLINTVNETKFKDN